MYGEADACGSLRDVMGETGSSHDIFCYFFRSPGSVIGGMSL